MALWLLWEPATSTFFITFDKDGTPKTKSCSLCKRKKPFTVSKSTVLMDREIGSYLGKELLSLDELKAKNPKMRILIPIIGEEWSISLSKDHDNFLINISKASFRKGFHVLLKKIKSIIGKGIKKHVYCFSFFNYKGEGTLFHPQFRCIALNHLYVASIFLKKDREPCLLCKLFSEYKRSNEKNIIFSNERFLVVSAPYEEATYILSKNHYNFLKIDLRNLACDLSTAFVEAISHQLALSNKKYGLDAIIFVSLDFVKNEHIYGRVISLLPDSDFEDKIRKIVADRYARYITGPLI